MRNRLTIVTAALLLASASLASAQEKPVPQQTQQTGQTVSTGTNEGMIDIAGRFTSTSGDEARYERYRDLRTGVNANFLYSRKTDDYIFNVTAENIGYRDQRFSAGYSSRRLKASFFFDQIPLNYSYETRTPYNCAAGSCTLDTSLRQQVENKTAIGIPQSAAQLGNPSLSIYNGQARQFDLRSLRSTVAGSVIYSATDNLDLTLDFNSYKRTGDMPWGASFAFPVGIELPLAIDNRSTNVTAGVEWASHQGMMRVAYDYSKFTQNIPSLTWDNPQRATDFCQYGLSGQAPGACYDPNGYTNGNGPADGRMAMAPTNTLATFSFLGMVKLPNRTTVNASLMMGANRQDAALIGWTTNPVIANPTVYATFPGLAELPRETAQMAVNYLTGTLNLNSRPHKYFSIAARYRFNSRNDFSPMFEGTEYVRFDTVPEEGGGETEQFQINRNTFDLNGVFTRWRYGSIRLGYTFDEWQHTTRATEGWRDDTFRVSFDSIATQYLTLRALYEHTKRGTINLSIEDLESAGMQPAARFFDEAARNRDRATFIVEVNPISILGINFTAATGRDDYQGADSSQQFGLLNNKNTVYTIGVNVAPNAIVNFGGEYGRETYSAFQQSRNANPLPDSSWTDPNRNWALTNDEHVNNMSLYANLVKVVAKTDIRFGYDYSDSDQAFVHSGPRIQAFATGVDPTTGKAACSAGVTSCFVALPDVTNRWQRLTFDLRHDLTKAVALGFSYWFEKFSVSDFATINQAGSETLPLAKLGAQADNTPRIDWLGGLFTGYFNQPYQGQTFFARLIYTF